MLEVLLRGYLVYLSFVQPVVYGAQLCHSPSPDPVQVTNVTLTLIFSWLLEVADVAFLSSFIAMRWLYMCARIVLALYFAHPRFLGAVQVYRKLFATLVDSYSPVIDSIVVRHVQTIGESGLMQYGALLTTGLMRGAAGVAGIAKTLLEASATTTVPAAPLPRRMSQARDVTVMGDSAQDYLEAVPPRGAAPAYAFPAPAAWSRPMQPPSLYDEDDTSPAGSSMVDYTVDEVPTSTADAWSDTDDVSEPNPRLGATYQSHREPETMVNRARFRATNSNPFDD